MPAVAQLQMIEALLLAHTGWRVSLSGGTGIKFTGSVAPGARLRLQLVRGAAGTVAFTIEQDDGPVAKGTVQTVERRVGH